MDYGILSAILSPILSSIATVFKSEATKVLSPVAVGSLGSILGGILIVVILVLRKRVPKLKEISKNKADFLKLAMLRSVLGELLFVFGLGMTVAIKSIFLTKFEPFFVLLLSWTTKKEKIHSKQIVLLATLIIGAFFLSTGGNFSVFSTTQIGDVLIIAAMAFFAGSYFYGKKLSEKMGATTTNCITQLIGGILLLPLLYFLTSNSQLVSTTGWTYVLIYVIIFNVIGLTMWYFSLKNVKPWMVSALRSVGPLAGAPIAFLLFGETLNEIQIIGAFLVLVASSFIVYEHRKKK